MAAPLDQASGKERILPLPPLPPEIKTAVDRNELVVFIGAGVSKIIGCKSWSELADELLSACFIEGCINYKEKQRLLSESNLKKKISICQYILDKQKSNLFLEKVKNSLELDKTKSAKFPIYEELHKLRAIYVTSNVDTYFDDLYFKDLIKYLPEDFKAETISRENLYHLHGTVRNINSLILTVTSYLSLYTDDKVKSFLTKLFDDYSVLFVGYGMDEFEILEFLFEKADSKKEKKHFILLPMFRGEENILAFEESYYGDLGISVIPYAIDEKGYNQLFYVIQNFEKEINLSSTFLYESFLEIEKNIDHYDLVSSKRILQLIKNDVPLENHFFKKLSSPDWLLPLKEAGYFDPNKNPRLQPTEKEGFYKVPYWNVLDYLVKISVQTTDINGKDYSNDLMEIVRSIANYKESGKRVDNFQTDRALIKIMSNLPLSNLVIGDIDVIRYFFHSGWSAISVSTVIEEQLIPNLIKSGEKEKFLQLIEIVISVNWQKRPFGDEPNPIMGDYHFNELIEKNKCDMLLFFPLDTAKIVIGKIEEITKTNKNFGTIRTALFEENVPNFLKNDFEHVISRLAKDLIVSAVSKEILPTKSLIEELLKKEHPFFKRLALAVIDSSWGATSDLFFKWVTRQALTNYFLHREIRKIFGKHFAFFSLEIKDRILCWIEEGPNWEKTEQNKEALQRDITYWKQDWVFALLPSGYQKAVEAYNKYKEITQAEIKEHKDIDIEPAVIELHGRSPISVQELAQKSSEEIVQFLRDVKEVKDSWSAPTIGGLASTLCELVKSDPARFENNLKLFGELPLLYKQNILQGFTFAQKENKGIKSENILNFCKDSIFAETFWTDSEKEASYLRNSFISQVADFIISGTKDDVKAFPKVNFPIVEEILLFLIERTKTDMQYPNDLLTSTLNSAKGQVISALVEYALHVARLKRKEKESSIYWSEPIKNEFSKRLDRTIEPSLEWSLSLGVYLPNLYFIDKEWVEKNIDNIFLKNDKTHWLATLEGYLTANVYMEIYDLLKSHNHLKHAISSEINKEMRERLVNQICIGFLRERESLSDDNSLLKILIDSWKSEDIINMIEFYWMQREYILKEPEKHRAEKTDYKKKILDFCDYLYSNLAGKANYSDDDKQVLSRLSLLACYVHKVDEKTLLWLQLAAKYVDEINSSFFVDYLDNICDVSPHEAGVIFLNFDSQLITYTKEDVIRSIISKLFRTDKELAVQICNTYFARGLEFIRDLYEANK